MKNKKIIGIYKIENTINGKFYIGCSGDIAKRWKQHIRGSSNLYLKNSLNKYGKESFIFTILEKCGIEMLYIREKFWMEKLKPVYNLIESIEGCYKHSDETIEKLSDVKKGENNPNYGKTGEKNPNYKNGWTLDPEKVKDYKKAKAKEWYLKNNEKRKLYNLKNAEKIKAYMKDYYLRKKMERLKNENKL